MADFLDKLIEEQRRSETAPLQGFGYASVKPIPQHASLLDKWAGQVCELPWNRTHKEDFHVTLAYDERNKVYPDIRRKPLPGKIYIANVLNLRVFEKNSTLVLELHSVALSRRHMQLRTFGFQHKYKSYIPHITLVPKKVKYEDFMDALDNLEELVDMFPEGIMFKGEKWEPVVD